MAGISCMSPSAPLEETAQGLNPDSCRMTARTNCRDNCFFAASVINGSTIELSSGMQSLSISGAGGVRNSKSEVVASTLMPSCWRSPMTSLNPVKSIGWQLEEAVLIHNDVTRRRRGAGDRGPARRSRSRASEQRVDDYPHQFSGGMRQRVMIAMALINNPEILIADEPTTALDVTTQAQILRLMRRLQEEHGTAIVMITHDLGVVAELADDVIVMYGGKVVEQAKVDDLFDKPEMPYTWGLLGSLPRLNSTGEAPRADPGPAAVAAAPADRLPVQSALRVRDVRMPRRRCRSSAGREQGESHFFRCHLDDEARTRIWSAKRACDGGGRCLMAEELLRVEGLAEALPRHARARVPEAGRRGQGGRRRQLHAQRRRDARRGRGVRLRQVDDGALHRPPARADRRDRSPSKAATSPTSTAPTCGRCGAT